MLQKNQPAPDFACINQFGKLIELKQFRNRKHIVLFFYPKDDTPGCTLEAKQFTALASEFAQCETQVFGVSKDSCASHQSFIEKYGLTVDLLSDTNGEMCEKYAVWQDREKDGVVKKVLLRSTFVIDKLGVLKEVHYGVSPDGHAQQVLQWVQGLA